MTILNFKTISDRIITITINIIILCSSRYKDIVNGKGTKIRLNTIIPLKSMVHGVN